MKDMPPRERILEAAAMILEVGVIADYTVNNVAHYAGVGISTFYSVFPGKKGALTQALLDLEVAAVLDPIPAGAYERDAESALWSLIGGLVSYRLRRPLMTRLLGAEKARLSTLGVAYDSGPLTVCVSRCLASPKFPHEAWETDTASEVLSLIDGLIDLACLRRDLDVGVVTYRVGRAVFLYVGNPASL